MSPHTWPNLITLLNPPDKPDVNVSTLSSKKSKDKEKSKGMTSDLVDKDENSVDKKD